VDPSANIGFLTFLVVDPNAETIQKGLCLKACVTDLVEEAEKQWNGTGIIYEVTKSVAVQRLLTGLKFQKGERGMTSMVRAFGSISTNCLEE